MGTGKTYSTKYLLDSNNSSGVAGQVLSTTSTGIDWVDANTVPGTGLWLASGNNIYNSNSGNVGIGTTAPTSKLTVIGADNTEQVRIGHLAQGLFIKVNGTRVDYNSSGNVSGYHTFSTGNVERMRITSGGNVGIGTTSPSTKLHVIGQDATFYSNTGDQSLQVGRNANERLELYVNDSMGKITAIQDSDNNGPHNFILNRIFAGTGSNDFLIQKDGSTQLAINTNGNVGIGTTSPGSKLEVNSSGSDSVARFTSTDARARILISDNNDISYFGTYIGTTFLGPDDTPSGNTINVLSNGNVGIGTTSPGKKLDVNGEARVNSILTLNRASVASLKFSRGSDFYLGIDTSGNLNFLDDSASSLGVWKNNGNLGIGTTNPVEKLQINSGDVLINNSTISSLKSGGSLYIDLNTFGSYSGRNFRISDNGTSLVNVTQVGNVGIGTTSPSAKLNVVGTGTQISSTGYYYNAFFKDTTNSGVLTGGNNTNNGVGFLAGINELAFLTFGTSWGERMRITGAGNVGIGTDDPSYKLHVNGGDAQIANGNTATLYMNNSANYLYGDVNGVGIVAANNNFRVKTNNSERLRIIQNGNVGIGTTSPSQKLDVDGNVSLGKYSGSDFDKRIGLNDAAGAYGAGSSYIEFEELSGTGTANFNKGGNIRFYNHLFLGGTSETLTLLANGNVGIGTTSPGTNLEVTSAAGAKLRLGTSDTVVLDGDTIGRLEFFSADSTNTNSGLGAFIDLVADGDQGNFNPNADLRFATSHGSAQPATTRMTIKGNGNVGIGTTSPGAKLHIKGSDPILLIQDDSTGTAQASSTLRLGESGAGGVLDVYWDIKQAADDLNTHLEINHSSNGNHLTILDNGNVGIGTTSPSFKLSVDGTVGIIGSRGTYIDASEDSTATSHIFTTNDDVGDFSQLAGNLVIQARVHPTVYRDIIFAGGLNTAGPLMTIQGEGNVGIGTTSPGYRLEVDGGIGDGVKIKAGNAASKDSLLVSTNNDVSKFLVQGDGKVIINSSTGISGRTENFQVFGKQIITNTGTDGPVLYLGYNSSGSNTIQLGRGRTADGLSYMDFNGEVMSAGQFGFRIIRYSGQNASTELNHIGTGAFKLTCTNSADIILNPNSGSVGISQTNPSHKLDVTGDGRFTSTVTATNFILSSDERLKENVEKVCDNRVEADWKTFELKTDKGQKRYGVIAQELEKTNPEFVREDSQGFKSVAYIDLLIAKIAELEARLEKLEK